MNSNGGDDSVVIVGGGVIGALCGWYLTDRGMKVTIVDKSRFGAACSHGNCGYISPSHVLPLTTPGAVSKSLWSMIKGPSKSPFYIKPRLSSDLVRWMWRFMRRCNERDMMQAAESLHRLLTSSALLYDDLVKKNGIECDYQEKGMLFVYQDEHEFHHFEAMNKKINERFGVSAEPWDARKLAEKEPALKPGLGGAWFFDCDTHLRPDMLMSDLQKKLLARGATIVEDCEVTGFLKDGPKARAIKTTKGEISGDQFIVAAGALTPFLNDALGCRISIQPGKGYSITMPRPEKCPTYPMIFEQHRVAITPMSAAYRIGSTMEFAGYDTTINEKRLNLLTTSAAIYLQEPTAAPIIEKWYGWRPMTSDSLPFIDRIPSINNGWLAAGHNMLGLSLGAVTGKLISEIISGETPHIDVAPFRIARK